MKIDDSLASLDDLERGEPQKVRKYNLNMYKAVKTAPA